MNCAATKALLTLYVLNDLDDATAATVRSHLETCSDCRAALQDIDSTLGLLRGALAAPTAAPESLHPARRARVLDPRRQAAPAVIDGTNWFTRHHRGLAAAAAALFVCGLIWLMLPSLSSSRYRASATNRMVMQRMAEVEAFEDSVEHRDMLEGIPIPATEINGNGGVAGGRPGDGPDSKVSTYGFAANEKPESWFRRLTPKRDRTVRLGVDASDADERIEAGAAGPAAKPARPVPGSAGLPIEPPAPALAPEPATVALDSESADVSDFDVVESVSPLRFNGLYASRSSGRRGVALRAYGGGGTVGGAISGEADGYVGSDAEAPADDLGDIDSGYFYFSNGKIAAANALDLKDELEPSPAEDRLGDLRKERSALESAEHELLAKQMLDDKRAADEKVAELKREKANLLKARAEREAEEAKRLRFTAYGVNPFVQAADEAFSTFGIDVDTASYTLARNMMAQGTLPPAEAVRTEEFVNAFDYGYVAPAHRTFRIYTELAPAPFGRGLHMLKIGVKGRRLGREEQRPAVLTFLVDTSGSMNAPERIGLVRSSLKLLVENLSPQDRVALIQYDSHARLLLEHTPASEKARILQVIDRMQCSGSTNLEDGMNEAYRLAASAFVGGAENRVLLLSDGVANLGSMAADDILKKVAQYRKQGIFCSVFGVGSGSYDDTMLETLANKGDGVYTFLDSEEQARRVFVDDLAATLNTIASDVKIQVEFNPDAVKQYRQLGYENRRLRKEDFRDDTVDAGEVGSGQSVTALYELELLPQLLARQQIWPHPRRLATVRVRYRRIDTGRVEEIERGVWPRDVIAAFGEAGNHFRLAAVVAEFSELLRGSPYAKGSSYEDVARLLRPIALDLHLDERVQELLRMVTVAESTPRGE